MTILRELLACNISMSAETSISSLSSLLHFGNAHQKRRENTELITQHFVHDSRLFNAHELVCLNLSKMYAPSPHSSLNQYRQHLHHYLSTTQVCPLDLREKSFVRDILLLLFRLPSTPSGVERFVRRIHYEARSCGRSRLLLDFRAYETPGR